MRIKAANLSTSLTTGTVPFIALLLFTHSTSLAAAESPLPDTVDKVPTATMQAPPEVAAKEVAAEENTASVKGSSEDKWDKTEDKREANSEEDSSITPDATDLVASEDAGTPAAPPEAISNNLPLLDASDEFTFLEQQIERGEADSAGLQLEVLIEQIEAIHHRYHPDLVRPLTLLGDAQLALTEHDKAVETYARARHIARVNHGLFSQEQLPVVYKEADAFMRIGDLDSAGEREEYAYEVARRAFAGPDPNAIPALARLARFYLDTYNPISARALLMRAIAIHERNGTDTTPEAIPLLRNLADTHRQTRFPPFYVKTSDDNRLEGPTPSLTNSDLDRQHVVVNSFPEGERALQKIVEIQRTHFPDVPTKELDAILELADWHLLFGRYQAAHTLYNHVFMQMAENDQRPQEFFATPTLLYFPRPENPRPPPARDRSELSEGLVSLSFTVTPDGQIRTLVTTASEPPKLMDFRVRRSMRVARFRPRYVEGQPAVAEAQSFTYRFPYFPLRSTDEAEDASARDTSDTADNQESTDLAQQVDTRTAPVQE